MTNYIDREDLVDDVRRVGIEVDAIPRTRHYHEQGDYSVATLIRRFGDWETVLDTAGFDTDDYDVRPGSESPYADLDPGDVGLSPMGERRAVEREG